MIALFENCSEQHLLLSDGYAWRLPSIKKKRNKQKRININVTISDNVLFRLMGWDVGQKRTNTYIYNIYCIILDVVYIRCIYKKRERQREIHRLN